jgi:hypothetical protein
MLVSAEIMSSWRSLLLSEASDESSLNTISLIRNCLYFEGIFSDYCFISIGTDAIFHKICTASVVHDVGIHVSSVKTFKSSWPQDHQNCFTKCLLFLDAYAAFNLPSCCSEIPRPKQLASTFCGTLLKRMEISRRFINLMIISILEMKNSMPEERVLLIFPTLERIVSSACNSQEEMINLISAIDGKTWERLKDDRIAYPDYHPICVAVWEVLHSFDNVLFESSTAEKIGLTWHAIIPSKHITLIAAKSYLALWKRPRSELQRKRFLEAYELELADQSLAKQEKFQNSFVELLRILNVDAPSPYLAPYTCEEISSAYFDILNILDSDKSNFFRLNVQYWHYRQHEEDDEMDAEEGGIRELMDDVTAASVFFGPDISKLVPAVTHLSTFGRRLELLPDVLSNALISSEILDEPPLISSQKSEMLSIFVNCWNALAIAIPSNVFKASLKHAASSYFPSEQHRMLDLVFVEFTMNLNSAYKESLKIVKTLLEDEKREYSASSSPFHAYISYFKNSELSDLLRNRRKEFFRDLTEEAILKLHAMKKGSAGPEKIAIRKQKQSKYDFINTAAFPKALVEFLCDCLDSCPEEFLAEYFKELLAKMEPQSSNNDPKARNLIETLAVSMVLIKNGMAPNLLDAFMKALLIKEDPPKISLDFIKLPLVSDIVVSFVNNCENILRPLCTELQKLMLESEFETNMELFKEVRDRVLNQNFNVVYYPSC